MTLNKPQINTDIPAYSILAEQANVIWLGHGMSLALCALGSSLCNMSGIESSYSTPGDANIQKPFGTVEISASNRRLSADPLLKIVGLQNVGDSDLEGIDDSNTQILPAVPTWAGIKFARFFLDWATLTFDLEIGGQLNNHIAMPSFEDAKVVILVDRHIQVFGQLSSATNQKIPNLNFIVAGAEEFGHGLHHLVWKDPDQFTIVTVRGADSDEAKHSATKKWLAAQKISITEVTSTHDQNTMEFLVQVFGFLLNMVVQRCESLDIDPDAIPIPVELDTLR